MFNQPSVTHGYRFDKTIDYKKWSKIMMANVYRVRRKDLPIEKMFY